MRPRELIALVGAGGKTTLMFALAAELRSGGRRVLTTTTTKIFPPAAAESPLTVIGGPETFPHIREGLSRHGHLTWAAALGPGGKLIGVTLPDLSRLWSLSWADVLIVEADGSARLPLKAPGPAEPVVPEETSLLVSVYGLSALGRPLDRTSAFRPEIISRLTGLAPGSPITPETLRRLAVHPEGGLKGWKAGMRAVCLLNQRDLPADPGIAPEIAASILHSKPHPFDRVITGQLKPKRHLAVTRL